MKLSYDEFPEQGQVNAFDLVKADLSVIRSFLMSLVVIRIVVLKAFVGIATILIVIILGRGKRREGSG